MKRAFTIFLLTICAMPVWSGILDDNKITAGEYGGLLTWSSYDTLIVDGGGALRIQVRDSGRLIVQSTSTPLQRYVSGVYDIILGNNAQLLYLDGVTEFIGMGSNATAVLRGGNINCLKAAYFVPTEHIFIYAYEDSWSWIDNDPLKGIQGTWLDTDLPFRIEFINDSDYSPTWMSVKVIPEPATLTLLGLGSLLIRRKVL